MNGAGACFVGALSVSVWCALAACTPVVDVTDAGPTGPAALGALCVTNTDCASGLCDGNQHCGPNDCPVVGDACAAPGTFCVGGPCARTCEAPRGRGERCEFRSDDNPCPTQAPCHRGLVCAERDFGEFGDGSCAPATERAAGEPCTTTTDCAAPLTCDAHARSCG